MALDLILDSLTRSVSEGILGENKQPKPLANASGYKVSAIALHPVDRLCVSRICEPARVCENVKQWQPESESQVTFLRERRLGKFAVGIIYGIDP